MVIDAGFYFGVPLEHGAVDLLSARIAFVHQFFDICIGFIVGLFLHRFAVCIHGFEKPVVRVFVSGAEFIGFNSFPVLLLLHVLAGDQVLTLGCLRHGIFVISELQENLVSIFVGLFGQIVFPVTVFVCLNPFIKVCLRCRGSLLMFHQELIDRFRGPDVSVPALGICQIQQVPEDLIMRGFCLIGSFPVFG